MDLDGILQVANGIKSIAMCSAMTHQKSWRSHLVRKSLHSLSCNLVSFRARQSVSQLDTVCFQHLDNSQRIERVLEFICIPA